MLISITLNYLVVRRTQMLRKWALVAVAAIAVFVFSLGNSALADGQQVFAANCAACHAGGKNLVNPSKTLSKADLEKYGKFSEEEIYQQAKNGAGAMPSLARLGDAALREVAAYVYEQAEAGW